MTAVMRAMQQASGPKVLRIGLVAAGRILEERIVKQRTSVTVGPSEKSTFVVQANLPPQFKLFELIGGDYYLNFLDGMTGRIALATGITDLVALKGHDLALRALREFPGACLLIIGEGREEKNLKKLAGELGVQDRVRFLGAMPQEQLAEYYGAADALVLTSSREGWPNVLLEAMACGTPVVSTSVGGTPEIVAAPEAGMLVGERSARGIVEALRRLFRNTPDRESTRRYAESYSWGATTAGQLDLFGRILSAGAAGRVKTTATGF